MRRSDWGESPPRVAAAIQRWWPALGVVGMLVLATAAAALSAPTVTKRQFRPIPSQILPSATASVEIDQRVASEQQRRAVSNTLPDWALTLALYACLAIAIAALAALIWAALRDRLAVRRAALVVERGGTPSKQRRQEVVAALDAGLDELVDLDTDPRRAVIACWVRLEHAAAAAGTPRELGDTPTDLVLRLLAAHRVNRRVLDRLAELYRSARYATHVVDERMRAEAIAALRQVRAELTSAAPSEGPVSGPATAVPGNAAPTGSVRL